MRDQVEHSAQALRRLSLAKRTIDESGNAARIRTVWVSHGRAKFFDAMPWRTVADLNELLMLLQSC